jgi:hypothetical protein
MMKHAVVLALSSLLFLMGCIQQPVNQTNGMIVVKEQGSFAVGGRVITNPGTFDPILRTPEGQTLHGDHAYIVLYTYPR